MSVERIFERIRPVIDDLERTHNISAIVRIDKEADIIRIYGEKSGPVRRALSASTEILDLAYTTAEHHPYWALLYHGSEISRLALENWELDLTSDDIAEIAWRCEEIKGALQKFKNR